MFATFSYDQKNQNMKIANKVNSDFIAHVALIRSFSLGDNLTRISQFKLPEYPLFPGEPIRYHFIFYMVVGVLEKLGLPIDWALNIPSILGFFSLLVAIFFLSKVIFNNTLVALFSAVFFLFNGSLAFIRFFEIYPISLHSLSDIYANSILPAFAPWGPGEISAFWNLNIYTNQRHLAGAFALVLLFVITAFLLESKPWNKQKPWAIIWGLILAVFPFFNQSCLLILAIIIACYWFLFPMLRKYLTVIGLLGVVLTLPQIMLIRHGPSLIKWYPGYLIHGSLSVAHFFSYWWYNIGLHIFMIPIGFIIAPLRIKKMFLPIIPIFILANLTTFVPEIATNHKFFNFVLVMGNMLSAYVIVVIYRRLIRLTNPFGRFGGLLSLVIIFFFLVFSGVIDFFAVKNDEIGIWPDYYSHPLARWALYNINPSETTLNADYIDPVSLAGRKIFLGWPYFSWGAGYDTNARIKTKQEIFKATSKKEQCTLLRKYDLSYSILVNPPEQLDFMPNYSIYSLTGSPVFNTFYGGIEYSVYDTESYCRGV